MYYQILDLSPLEIDLQYLLDIAEASYSDSNKWFYAEPEDIIEKIGKSRVFQDVEIEHSYIQEKILKKVTIPQGEVYSSFYKLPGNNGFSPIHVDGESCNILIPLHDTENNAYVNWYKWPENVRDLTEKDWELYRLDWNKYPICEFSEDLPLVKTYYWKKGEAILLNTREPHSSYNYHSGYRINFVLNFYGISFTEVLNNYLNGLLFKP